MTNHISKESMMTNEISQEMDRLILIFELPSNSSNSIYAPFTEMGDIFFSCVSFPQQPSPDNRLQVNLKNIKNAEDFWNRFVRSLLKFPPGTKISFYPSYPPHKEGKIPSGKTKSSADPLELISGAVVSINIESIPYGIKLIFDEKIKAKTEDNQDNQKGGPRKKGGRGQREFSITVTQVETENDNSFFDDSLSDTCPVEKLKRITDVLQNKNKELAKEINNLGFRNLPDILSFLTELQRYMWGTIPNEVKNKLKENYDPNQVGFITFNYNGDTQSFPAKNIYPLPPGITASKPYIIINNLITNGKDNILVFTFYQEAIDQFFIAIDKNSRVHPVIVADFSPDWKKVQTNKPHWLR